MTNRARKTKTLNKIKSVFANKVTFTTKEIINGVFNILSSIVSFI